MNGQPSMTCTIFANTKQKVTDPITGTMDISQVGDEIRINVGIDLELFDEYLIGKANAEFNTPNKGAAGAIPCNRLDSRKLGMFMYRVDDVKGQMKVEVRGLIGQHPATCKATFVRTATVDPGVPACPP